jgi:hypothetical protein
VFEDQIYYLNYIDMKLIENNKSKGLNISLF